jgi:small nuclear ribonucleoprotein (snRNP)-like protein
MLQLCRGVSGRPHVTARSPEQNHDEVDRLIDQVAGVREQLDRFNSSLAAAAEAERKAYNALIIKPGPEPRPRAWLQWELFIPFALAYLGIGGYAVAYAYLRGYYSAVLPGIPIAYPYLDTIRVLIAAPLLLTPFALFAIMNIGLSATRLPRRTLRCLMEALPFIESSAKSIHAADDALRKMELVVRREAGAPEPRELFFDEKEALAVARNDVLVMRQRALALIGVSWRVPYRLATVSLRRGVLPVYVHMFLVTLILVAWPLLVIQRVHTSWLSMLLIYAFGLGLVVGFLILFASWRVAGLTFVGNPGRTRLMRLFIVSASVATLVVASMTGGLLMGYNAVLDHNFFKVSVTLQDGSTVNGDSVRVESSPNLYLLTNTTDQTRTVRIVPANQIETVVGQP